MRPTDRLLVIFSASCLSLTCGKSLSKFLNEDKEIVISYVGDNSSSLNADSTGAYVTVQFSADRFVNYSIRYGADCTTGVLATSLPQTGSANANVTVSARMNYTELVATAGTGLICASDSAAYKKASLIKNFAATINGHLTSYNELSGASGAALSTGFNTEYQIFQVEQVAPGWSNNLVNRDGGVTKQSGVNFNYGMLAAIDPNDSYRLKLFIMDRNNNRVLVFNSIPQTNATDPDVVIGQTDFVSGTGAVSQQNYNEPVSATVCADGKLYISDRSNHRIAGYNRIPTSNGAAMDFVIGQPNFTTNSLAVASATSLNLPYGVSCIRSRLYISDRGNNRVVVFNPAPTTTGASASFAIGQPSLNIAIAGTDYSAFSNYLSNPAQVMYTGSQFFIADINNSRVLVFNSLPGAALAVPSYVIGQPSPGASSNNQCACATPGQTTLYGPRAFAYRSGKLAISDYSNNRLMFFDLPISASNPTGTHQMGQPDFVTGAVPSAQKGTFSTPKDVLFDGNYIWVQDSSNHRLQRLLLPF